MNHPGGTSSSHGLLAAAARRDITPLIGTGLSGFIARLEPSRGIADPLAVRACVLEDQAGRMAIVQCDLLGLARWHVDLVREYAWEQLGIPRERLLISCSHTHSGPGLVRVRGCRMAPFDYHRQVISAIQQALAEAVERLAPARLAMSRIPCRFGVNRRQITDAGAVLGIAEDKPAPRYLDLVSLRGEDTSIDLYSHACHPYMLGGDSLWISGDFAGAAAAELEQDGRTIAMFLNGCAGNIAPRNGFAGLDACRREGQRLAAAVRAARAGLRFFDEPIRLQASHLLVELPYAPLPRLEDLPAIAAAPERVVRTDERGDTRVQAKIGAALDDWRHTMERVLRGDLPLEPALCEVQTLAIGEWALVGISGEPFFEIGEALRPCWPGALWPLGYTNAYSGYLPASEEVPAGGYEVDDWWKYLATWKLAPEAAQRVLRAAHSLLRGLQMAATWRCPE